MISCWIHVVGGKIRKVGLLSLAGWNIIKVSKSKLGRDMRGRDDADTNTVLRYCVNDGTILFLHTSEADSPENATGVSLGLRRDLCMHFIRCIFDRCDRVSACAVGGVCKICGKELSGVAARRGAQCIVLYVR